MAQLKRRNLLIGFCVVVVLLLALVVHFQGEESSFTAEMATDTSAVAIDTVPALTPSITGPQEVTIYVDDGYRPFSYAKDGRAEGMYIDVLRAVFDQMKLYRVTLKPIPWQRGKKLMEEGKGFGLAPAFFHGHDWSYLYPYSLPFYTETISAFCVDSVLTEPRPNWPWDYVGLRVGNVYGFDGWGGKDFYKLVQSGRISYDYAQSSSCNILKLGARRLDCIMMEERAFEHEMKRLEEKGTYESGFAVLEKGTVISSDPVYIGYSRPAIESGRYPFHQNFRQTFDSILYRMLKSNEVDSIMNAYQE